MKKKDYNQNVSYQNTPHLQKLTWLLGIAYATLSLNTIMAFLHTKCHEFPLLILVFVFVIMIPTSVTDPRRGNRGLFAVVGAWIVAICYTLFLAWGFSFFALYIVLAAEVLILFVYLVLSHRFAKRRLKKKG